MTRRLPVSRARAASLLGLVAAAALGLVVLSDAAALAQQAPPSQQPRTPQSEAPFDLTGTWVSVVTEDWRWRMVVPRQGDYSSVPLNAEGRRVADGWTPERMADDGCRAYGAAAIMRVPGRLRVTWDDDATLRIETDAGQQTRLLRFDAARAAAPERTWQGQSIAEWQRIPQPGGLGVSLQQAAPRLGALKVVTTNLAAGYLRTNGVPYSEQAVVTEYFDRLAAYDADWMTVLTIVDDPQYLDQPFITSTHFKREADDSNWRPSPCDAAPRVAR